MPFRAMPTCCTRLGSKVLGRSVEKIPNMIYSRTQQSEDAPDTPEYIPVDFDAWATRRDQWRGMSPATLLEKAERLWREHALGRSICRNLFRMKSARHDETAGGTIYHAAHRGSNSWTLVAVLHI